MAEDELWSDDWKKGFYPEGKVFCYFGPAWLVNFSMAADLRYMVSCPTLIIYGEKDRANKNASIELANMLIDAELQVFRKRQSNGV